MGRFRLVARLAARDLRRRRAEAALLLLAITASTATLTLGLVLHDAARDPYRRTRDATAGPDVVASIATGTRAADPARLDAFTRAPGVVAHSGPYPVTGAVLGARGQRATAQVEGRDPAPAAVDQPAVTDGRWVHDGGVVIEAAFAHTLGVRAGDHVTLDDHRFRVDGVAVTAAAPPYPVLAPPGTAENPLSYCQLPAALCDRAAGPAAAAELRRVDGEHPGLVWATRSDAGGLARPGSLNYVVNLDLRDPAAAPAFVAAHRAGPEGMIDPDAPALLSWQQVRAQISDDVARNRQEVLLIGSRLLALLAVATVAVLVGGRMADQTRRGGLLKAVGGTPGLVASVLLAEHVVVALVAAAAGLAVGWLTAPLLADPGAGLLGTAGSPSIGASTVALVAAVALGVAAAATLLPALRAARTSTVRALADAARTPRRSRRLIAVSARLPVPLLLGLRAAARRPRRTVLGVLSTAIAVTGIVAALATRAGAQVVEDRGSTIKNESLDQVLLMITVTLVALAAVNAIVVTWATVLDNRHAAALIRALGATPQQVGAGFSAAQVLPALAGAVLGVPSGLALVAALGGGSASAPPLWQLLAVVAATGLAVAALASIPAHHGARHPAGESLQAELV